MDTNGEQRFYSLKRSILKQLEDMKRDEAMRSYESQLIGTKPDEFDLINYLAKRQMEEGADIVLTTAIEVEPDGRFWIIYCDANKKPIELG